jgi:hypothetical protein
MEIEKPKLLYIEKTITPFIFMEHQLKKKG